MNWHKLVEDKQKLFWLLQISGWAGYGIANYLGALMHEKDNIYVILFSCTSGFVLTLLLRFVLRFAWRMPLAKMVLVILSSSYITGVIWAISKKVSYWEYYKHGFRPESWVSYTGYSVGSAIIILCWSGLYFCIKYYQVLQHEKEKALKATNMAQQAQLKMLRYQLNPHFLFNTLNAISTLILLEENKTANAMVSKLSDFLRYSLDKDPIKKTTVEQEISALTLYLDIEKVRFEERLTVQIDVEPNCLNALVPSLILQPLIENSVKYAIAMLDQGGTITVKITSFGRDLLIEVSDNGPGADIIDGQLSREGGVGLANTKERLLTLYEGNHSFVVSHNEPTGLIINIRLPLEIANEQ